MCEGAEVKEDYALHDMTTAEVVREAEKFLLDSRGELVEYKYPYAYALIARLKNELVSALPPLDGEMTHADRIARSCSVLGNGPGLKPENIPDGAFLIGVNRSYKVAWSPIVCAVEGEPALAAYAESGAFIYVKRGTLPIGMPRVAVFDPPKWAYNAGAFGIWIAAYMRFDRIYLVGFGGQGHFDAPDSFGRAYYQEHIREAIRFAEALGSEVVRVGEEVVA